MPINENDRTVLEAYRQLNEAVAGYDGDAVAAALAVMLAQYTVRKAELRGCSLRDAAREVQDLLARSTDNVARATRKQRRATATALHREH